MVDTFMKQRDTKQVVRAEAERPLGSPFEGGLMCVLSSGPRLRGVRLPWETTEKTTWAVTLREVSIDSR